MPLEAEIVLDRAQLCSVTLDDEELMRELLAALLEDTSRQIPALDRAIREGKARETARLAHYSKGACANVGANSTAAILQQIERKAAGGDLPACAESLGRLADELAKVRSAARELTEPTASPRAAGL